ncbi:SnoaL-like polyketide cyclase [Aliiruegeria lutimaris]|uniref:SnoaL-like polyketide cyclase n=2 Tax=Aliiruegeria lutimaris TaxID=571298 RepID=A0A1G9B3Z2_9RHOB|nr:SnoaL-like polyketide cyclase [Aliiruegeria lutimaris]
MTGKMELIQAFYDRVWVAGAVEEAEAFFDASAEASGLMPDLEIGGEEFHEFVAALLEQLKVTRVTLEKTVEEGEWISVMATFDATVLMTGQTISGSGMLVARIVDGRIVEAFNCLDFLGLFEKLGLVPENALALCMTGQRLS